MPVRQRPRRWLPLLSLLLFSTFAWGQDHYWVDEQGNKHYGDRIVPNEQRQSTDMPRGTTWSDPALRQPDSQSDNCAARWAAYERSAACFASCRTPTGNIANCGHCRQMPKPDC